MKSDEKFFKFLGFRIDNKLSWKYHIQHVTKKLSTANYIIATVKNSFPKHIKRLIYMSLGQSHIEYGLPIWFNQNLGHIEKIQKKIIRNICKTKYNAHTQNLFGENKILKSNELHQLTTIRLVKKTLNNDTPIRLRNLFHIPEQNRTLRNQNIKITGINGRILYDIPKIWNQLPYELKLNEISCKYER